MKKQNFLRREISLCKAILPSVKKTAESFFT